MKAVRFLFSVAAVALLTLCAVWASGCATTGESDIPWNEPQPWEGMMSVPGLGGGGGSL
jgi:hypothetical protein